MINDKPTQTSLPINKFLEFLKQETGLDVTTVDAVFHHKFARYRHLPYPDIEADTWKADYMARTWINVILHEGMTDKHKSELFPKRFDLGHTESAPNQPEKLSALIAEINSSLGNKQGEKLAGKTSKDFQTVLNGIRNTIEQDFSDNNLTYPTSSLKVINLLYKMTRSRKSHLFGLIEPPQISKNPTLEFRDTAPDPLNEDNSLIIADLISYLSIEIPAERLKKIHVQLLTSSKLLECIALENMEITESIRTHHQEDDHRIASAYQELTESIERYEPEQLTTIFVSLDEILYTYLRTLEFQHFVGDYEKVAEKSIMKNQIDEINVAINDLCNLLSEEMETKILPNTPVTSINGLQDFVEVHAKQFIEIVKSATGFSVRINNIIVNSETGISERINNLKNIIDHASKILSMYSFHTFGEKNLDAIVISVSDCIAALCTIRHQQDKKTTHASYVFGQKTPSKSPLRLFAKEKTVKDLQELDYIPQGVSQLMYIRFCHIHSYMTGNEKRHDAWMQFNITRLKKYVQCLQTYNIDCIISSVSQYNNYCRAHTIKYRIPQLPDSLVYSLNKWVYQGIE